MRTPTAVSRSRPAAGCKKLATIFSNPKLPSIDDYYEPWTYDYETLLNSPAHDDLPRRPAQVAASRGKA